MSSGKGKASRVGIQEDNAQKRRGRVPSREDMKGFGNKIVRTSNRNGTLAVQLVIGRANRTKHYQTADERHKRGKRASLA